MKKNFMKFAAAVIAACTLASCATINSGAAISSNSAVGSKMGEAQSTIICGLVSTQGEQNNIKQAAANGGITKISHVEYVDQSIIGGLIIKHTTRVYGE
jgi:F0F1-type ATP synthase delta subunit